MAKLLKIKQLNGKWEIIFVLLSRDNSRRMAYEARTDKFYHLPIFIFLLKQYLFLYFVMSDVLICNFALLFK